LCYGFREIPAIINKRIFSSNTAIKGYENVEF